MAAFRLAHLSDPHLPPLPAARLRDLAGKRALGYLNWTRNRHKYHRRDVLDAPLPRALKESLRVAHTKLDCSGQHFRSYTSAAPSATKKQKVRASKGA